jgi:hypothetical protein
MDNMPMPWTRTINEADIVSLERLIADANYQDEPSGVATSLDLTCDPYTGGRSALACGSLRLHTTFQLLLLARPP